MINSILSQSQQLKKRKLWREAVELLSDANRLDPDIAIERALTDFRIQAHSAIKWPKPRTPWAGEWEEARPGVPQILEIDASDFNVTSLARGVLGHGALLVRGLIPEETAEEIKRHIDNSIAARRADDKNSPWNYRSPYATRSRASFSKSYDQAKRAKVIEGSIWAADSPRAMHKLIEVYESIGLRSILAQYLGESPALSVRKWILRRIAPDAFEAGWHQDGRFMGTDTDYHSVNMWLPLSECGGTTSAAGMEIIPIQSREILETGTRGAPFNWTVGKELVEELKQTLPVYNPTFQPGDALFFDHWNLHRTAFGPHLTNPRYAVESWFFSSSSIPRNQMPILF